MQPIAQPSIPLEFLGWKQAWTSMDHPKKDAFKEEEKPHACIFFYCGVTPVGEHSFTNRTTWKAKMRPELVDVVLNGDYVSDLKFVGFVFVVGMMLIQQPFCNARQEFISNIVRH